MVCSCRKPAPTFGRLKGEDIDLNRSAIFGDKASDIKAGQRRALSHLVSTDMGKYNVIL